MKLFTDFAVDSLFVVPQLNLTARSFQRLPDGGPFVKVSVKEFLWGYKSILYSLKAINENPDCQLGGGGEEDGGGDDDDDFFSSDDDFGSESDEPSNPECEIGIGNIKEFGLFMVRRRNFIRLKGFVNPLDATG